ncbi:hypothetical protein CROQUDRAFT_670152 [Cronartium quercuum f. sp. fusiforme G11]|uniref:Uncharacterized protein n=1 Tax=Cronartium quercuum f. sp. fusiforme G11 TaxID=708437 RepID=A0A9P6NJ84_9BASI|nr:hypothetical protein CROQUDRAFT_670152 [Cronartium quercuum f. sp. fusiforme G11]
MESIVPIQETIIGYRLGYLMASPVMGLILGVCFRQTYRFHASQTEVNSSCRTSFRTSFLASPNSLSYRRPSTVQSFDDSRSSSSSGWRDRKKYEHWRVWTVCLLAALAFLFLAIDNLSAIWDGRPTRKTLVKIDPAGYLIPAFSGAVQLVVQTYFLGSLYGITKSKVLVCPIWLLAVISFVGSCGRTITIAISKDGNRNDGVARSAEARVVLARTSMAMYILWLGGAVLVDLSLALGLSYNLKKSGYGGFKSTQSLVTKLADGFLMTFSCSALVVVITAFVFFVPQVGTSDGRPIGIGIFNFMTFLHVPTYYLSFIYTLTRRKEIAEDLRTEQSSGNLTFVDLPTSTPKPKLLFIQNFSFPKPNLKTVQFLNKFFKKKSQPVN